MQTKIKKTKKKDGLMVNDDDVDELLRITSHNRGSSVDLSSNLNEVTQLQLQHKKQKHHNAHGLNSLAKIFHREQNAAVETPAIFALLRAAHTVGR